jgi:hypothetical protein
MDYSGQSCILEEVTMQILSPASQIQFLTNLQRLLDEGIFTASYKYALLMSLADISVELLAGIPHLKRWVQRNTKRGEVLESYFREQGVLHDLSVSDQIARWAYDQAEVAGAKVWNKREQIVALDSAWRAILKNN